MFTIFACSTWTLQRKKPIVLKLIFEIKKKYKIVNILVLLILTGNVFLKLVSILNNLTY